MLSMLLRMSRGAPQFTYAYCTQLYSKVRWKTARCITSEFQDSDSVAGKKVVSLNSRMVAELQRETRKKVICRDLSIFKYIYDYLSRILLSILVGLWF